MTEGKLQKRKSIEAYFRHVAAQENLQNNPVKFEDFLGKDDDGKRVLYVIPESAGDILLATALFEDIKILYPDWNLYVAVKPEFEELLFGNPYIYKVIPYHPQMDNLLWLEGIGDHPGYFQVAYLAHLGLQRMFNYQHNNCDKTNINFYLNG